MKCSDSVPVPCYSDRMTEDSHPTCKAFGIACFLTSGDWSGDKTITIMKIKV